jgi:hypothetical protein
VVIRLFALAESDTGYVHRRIPNYGKLTGDVCNLPYSENHYFKNSPFLDGQTMTVRLLLNTTTFSLTDIIAVLSWPKNWTIKNVSTHFAFYIYALVAPTFGTNHFT